MCVQLHNHSVQLQLIDPSDKFVAERLFFAAKFQSGVKSPVAASATRDPGKDFERSLSFFKPVIFLIAGLGMDFLTRGSDGFPDFPI